MSGKKETPPVTRIQKYRIDATGISKLGVGAGAIPRHFGLEGSNAMLWIEVFDRCGPKTRHFTIIDDGEEIPDGAKYIGSTAVTGGMIHLYEVL